MKPMALVLVALSLVAFGLTRMAPNGSALSAQTNKKIAPQRDKEVATPIREGVITEQQREHSKLYKEFRTDKNIRDLAAIGIGDVEVEKIVFPPMGGGVPCPEPCDAYPHAFLKGIVYDADAVIIGTIKDKSSQLTEDGDFIFTDYDVSVEDILKNNLVKSLQAGDSITITRPGGAVQLKNRVVRAIDTSFKSFEIGSRYILFLRFIPNTEAYRAFSNGSFQMRNDHIIKLTNVALWDEKERTDNAAAFLTEVRDAITIVRIEAPKGSVRLQ